RKVAENGLPPNAPGPLADFSVAISNGGTIDPQVSIVDGKSVVSGTATANTIDVLTVDGKRYFGHLVHTGVTGGQPVLTLAGRFGPSTNAANETAEKGKKAKSPKLLQEEGTWVASKP